LYMLSSPAFADAVHKMPMIAAKIAGFIFPLRLP
jgi:hypothetical protein